jgi:pectinesterase
MDWVTDSTEEELEGGGHRLLLRAWGPYSRVVFIRTYIEDLIIPAGWYDWGVTSRTK